MALAAVFAAAQAALLAHTAWDKSDTVDEPLYVMTSVRQWLWLDFAHNCESPALPKWGFGAALRLVDPALFHEPSDWWRDRHPLWSRDPPELRRNLLAARAATVLVTVAGGMFLWAAARSFGAGPALVTHALWCFSPTVLGSGALATLDAWAASLCCVVIWATARTVARPAPWRAAIVGAACALAAASKVTALGVVPVALAVIGWALARDTRRRGSRLVFGALAFGGAFLFTLAAVYGFKMDYVNLASLCGRPRGVANIRLPPSPFADYIEGLFLQWLHGQRGHYNYVFGKVSSEGWWWFYLAALALKTTIGAQLLGGLGLLAWTRTRRPRREWLVDGAILAYPLLLLAVMSAGRTQNGIKYLLPAFPFLMLWAGRVLPAAERAFGRRGRAAVAMALGLAVAESLWRHPHHLMFFNLWIGGPERGPRYFVHGDDWGQDQRRVGEWQRANRVGRLWYTYYCGLPSVWGINSRPPRCRPEKGRYALHAVEVHRPKRIDPGCLDWLTVEPPDERLGYSIYIYRVDEERLTRLAQNRFTATPFWRSGPAPTPRPSTAALPSR